MELGLCLRQHSEAEVLIQLGQQQQKRGRQNSENNTRKSAEGKRLVWEREQKLPSLSSHLHRGTA